MAKALQDADETLRKKEAFHAVRVVEMSKYEDIDGQDGLDEEFEGQ